MNSTHQKTLIRRWFESLTRILNVVATFWIFIVMMIIVVDVLLRFVFNISFLGTAEIIRNTIVIIVFFQIAFVLNKGRHIRSTLIFSKVNMKYKVFLNVFASALGILLFIVLAIVSWDPLVHSIISKQYEGEGALRVPTFPARLAIIIGSIFISIQFMLNIYDSIKYKYFVEDEEDDE